MNDPRHKWEETSVSDGGLDTPGLYLVEDLGAHIRHDEVFGALSAVEVTDSGADTYVDGW